MGQFGFGKECKLKIFLKKSFQIFKNIAVLAEIKVIWSKIINLQQANILKNFSTALTKKMLQQFFSIPPLSSSYSRNINAGKQMNANEGNTKHIVTLLTSTVNSPVDNHCDRNAFPVLFVCLLTPVTHSKRIRCIWEAYDSLRSVSSHALWFLFRFVLCFMAAHPAPNVKSDWKLKWNFIRCSGQFPERHK